MAQLTARLEGQRETLYQHLTPWQKVQVARHPQRPHFRDLARLLATDFVELHGDRRFADDPALVGGPARLPGRPLMLMGHQKGSDTRENLECNFGMCHPEGYRKAQRLMLQAEKFGLPVVSLIDTPGASPVLEDEERGQAEAIASSLALMARLRVPIVAVIVGEGGSGGALAIGMGDRVLMLEHGVYSVASPEGCAAIIWRDAAYAQQAAEAMQVTAQQLLDLQLIDGIIAEPLGGAHRDHRQTAEAIAEAVLAAISELESCSPQQLVAWRRQRYRAIGCAGGD